MERLAHRCATVAAAALAVGGMVAALTPMTQSPPDVQIRDLDLAAANVDPVSMVDVGENHIRADLSGNGDVETQHITLGDVLFDRGDGDLSDGTSFNLGDVESELSAVLNGSGGFDPQQVLGVIPPDFDLGAIGAPSVAGFSGGDQAGAAAAGVSTAIIAATQAFPAAQQAFNAAVVAIEQEFNRTLVAAQEAAAERLFGDNPEVNDAVNWIFGLNNTVLAQQEDAFNNLFGITYEPHETLLANVDPGLAEADWSTLLGFSPEEFHDIVEAIQADNLTLLLGSIDWAGLFDSLF